MSLAVKIPVDDQALAATSAQAKIIRQEINALQVQIQKTAALGIPIAKEAEARLKSLRGQYSAVTKARDEIKANISSGRGDASFSTRDIHTLKALAEGHVSPHIAHRILDAVGDTKIGKAFFSKIGVSAAGLSEIGMPLAIISEMVWEHFKQQYEKRSENIKTEAETFLETSKRAEQIGLSETILHKIRKNVETADRSKMMKKQWDESQTTAAILDAIPLLGPGLGAAYRVNQATNLSADNESQMDKLNREAEEKLLDQIKESRKLTNRQLGISEKELLKTNGTPQELNERRDQAIYDFLLTPKGQKALRDSQSFDREQHLNEIQKKLNRETYPSVAFFEKERDEHKAVAYSLRSKRIPANPVDF